MKLPALYTIDSILKNVGEPFRSAFVGPGGLVDAFISVVKRLSPGAQIEQQVLFDASRVLLTWRGLLDAGAVARIEANLPIPLDSILRMRPSSQQQQLQQQKIGQPGAALASAPPLPPTAQLLEILGETLQRIKKDPAREYTQRQSLRLHNLFTHIRIKAELGADLLDRIEALVREERFAEAHDQAVAASLSLALASTDLLSSLAAASTASREASSAATILDENSPENLFSNKLLLAPLSASKPAPALLYSKAVQCKNCALRFADDEIGRTALAKHLDMHFRRNIRLKELLSTTGKGSNTVQVRGWFLRSSDWISYGLDLHHHQQNGHDSGEGGSTTTASITSIFEQQQRRQQDAREVEAKRPAESLLSIPEDVAESARTCPACLEPVSVVWSDDRDCWCWRNAANKNAGSFDEIYHIGCLYSNKRQE